MKRILIYMYENELSPVGGPKGYVYNLKQGLDCIKNDKIDICYLPGKSNVAELNNRLKKMNDSFIKRFVLLVKSVLKKGKMMYGISNKAVIDINQFDAVHFHSTLDLYCAKNSLIEYKGKVILTSHTPTMPSKEVFALLTPFEKKYMKWFYKKLATIDEYAFSHADYLVFPCEEAEEPYYHEWPNYNRIHDANSDKYRYMPTGTSEKNVLLDRAVIRNKYNIPENAFCVCYVGRHNEIKGYNDLKKIGEKMLAMDENIYFLIAGKEEPEKGINHRRWIEIGWTNDPGSLINASDIFVLPNKETYFDLVMLEVLSLGQLILASNTGGNKYFKRFANNGIMLFDTCDQAIEVLFDIKNKNEIDLATLRNSNKNLFVTYFNNEMFAKNYIELIESIVD